jgi:outer membrane receptor protein involved in Fe transport
MTLKLHTVRNATAGGAILLSYALSAHAAAPEKLEEIIVTASKRTERLREVAGSVVVETGAALEARGARDAEDLVKTTPGVIMNKLGPAERSMLTIRGISTVSFNNIVQGTAGLYVEDVPFNDSIFPASNPDVAPFDLSRIEVLKGPQGALYGSMSLGGAMRYLVNNPDLSAVSGSVLLNGESMTAGGGGYSAYGMVNVPIVKDRLAVRAVAFKRSDSGYIDKPLVGQKDVNDLDQEGGRVLAAWQIAPGWLVTGLYQEQTTIAGDGAEIFDAGGTLDSPSDIAIPPSRSKWKFANLQLEGDLGRGLTLSSNTGWINKEFNLFGDATNALSVFPTFFGFPPFPKVTNQLPATTDAWSQELRVSGTGERVNWLVGAFYQQIDFNTKSLISVPGGPGATYAPIAAFLFTQSSPGVFTDLIVDFASPGRSKESAVFADLDVRIGEKWTLGVGARHTRTKQAYTLLSDIPLFGPPAQSPLDRSESATTPKVSLKRTFGGDSIWYASISRGFRFGGVNDGTPPQPYKSDQLTNYETGLRLTPMAAMALDLAVFYVDWKDSQIIALDNAGASRIINAGKIRITGLEAALNHQIGDFSWGAAATYTDAETREPFPSLFAFNSTTVLDSTPAGARLPGTPKLQGSVNGAYRFAGPFATNGRVSTVIAYQGERVGSTIAIPVELPSFTTVDLRLAFDRGPVEVALFANNVFDERGLVGADKPSAAAPSLYTVIRPRTIGASLRVNF